MRLHTVFVINFSGFFHCLLLRVKIELGLVNAVIVLFILFVGKNDSYYNKSDDNRNADKDEYQRVRA